jgi:hypothetical protein
MRRGEAELFMSKRFYEGLMTIAVFFAGKAGSTQQNKKGRAANRRLGPSQRSLAKT